MKNLGADAKIPAFVVVWRDAFDTVVDESFGRDVGGVVDSRLLNDRSISPHLKLQRWIERMGLYKAPHFDYFGIL